MTKDGKRRTWLPALFWSVVCASALLLLVPAAEEAAHPSGEFAGLVVFGLLALAAILAVIAIIVAIIRKPAAYAIGLVFASVPLVWWGETHALDAVAYLSTPSETELEAGRGYFTAPGDRALAEAIVAADAARVAALAPAANLAAVGWNGMTFMELALAPDHPDFGVLGALLRAGIDADQDGSALYQRIYNQKDAALLQLVIDSGVDLKHHMGRGEWFLFSRYDWPEELALLLDHGVDTEAEDAMGYTEIMRATQSSSWPTVAALLAHGAHTDHVGHDKMTLRDLLPKGIAESRTPVPPEIIALQARLN